MLRATWLVAYVGSRWQEASRRLHEQLAPRITLGARAEMSLSMDVNLDAVQHLVNLLDDDYHHRPAKGPAKNKSNSSVSEILETRTSNCSRFSPQTAQERTAHAR